MTTLLYTHDICLAHQPGEFHPERPERLEAVLKALAGEDFEPLVRREAPVATTEALGRVHPPGHVESLLARIPAEGRIALDPDTVVSPHSGEAALRAAGALIGAVDAVMTGEAANAFCAVRPPGHHAEATRAMGFCLFNNVAVGAYHARAVHGASRVAVVDFDVHHGNGTQAAFWDDADMLYASTHQYPYYPGTGGANETGESGNIVNCPLAARSGGAEFRDAMNGRLLPALDAFGPDLILISAGFDAHRDDPLAGLEFDEEDFAWATERLMEHAARSCGGRIVSALEGGYDLASLAACTAIHVRTLMGA